MHLFQQEVPIEIVSHFEDLWVFFMQTISSPRPRLFSAEDGGGDDVGWRVMQRQPPVPCDGPVPPCGAGWPPLPEVKETVIPEKNHVRSLGLRCKQAFVFFNKHKCKFKNNNNNKICVNLSPLHIFETVRSYRQGTN